MQAIHDIAEICAKKGVKKAVLSPGSRCAPLTIAFAQHPQIEVITISDERSAAFIAMGIAQASDNPVVIICTSGTASLNYAPAITEAYYQNIPLLVLTADRPPEWIDQLDGQTIRQQNIYSNHIKKSFNLPVDNDHTDSAWHINRIFNEGINIANNSNEGKGPVHFNIPLREPFYPSEPISFTKTIRTIDVISTAQVLSESQIEILQEKLDQYTKILVVPGQGDFRSLNLNQLNIPVVADSITNVKGDGVIDRHDFILGKHDENLAPDLVLTFGKSIISKSLKLFLRKLNIEHWHIGTESNVADTYQSLTSVIKITPQYFFSAFIFRQEVNFKNSWTQKNEEASAKINTFLSQSGWSEFKAIDKIVQHLPDGVNIHVANSMPVRYLNYLELSKKNFKVYANRGTSGIDGSMSTAVGVSMATDVLNVLITGDLSFFYDRNALWNNYLPDNFRIVILNNHGGGIFRMIDGPAKQKELEPYFVTEQRLTAQKTAEDYHLPYFKVKNEEDFKNVINLFLAKSDVPQIIEVTTDGATNTAIFKQFKAYGK